MALPQLRTSRYGYELRQALADHGLPVEEGTLYPLLRRLESQEVLQSEWRTGQGQPRRYYRLSPQGEQLYQRLIRSWRGLNDAKAEAAASTKEAGAAEAGASTAEAGGAEAGEAPALLTAFGRPADVAARYQPTITIIDPADSRTFLKASVIGVALIWVIGLLNAFQHRPASVGDGLLVLRDFYFSVGLPALIWPGILVVWFGAAAWARRRWPDTGVWKPRPEERDAVNRSGSASAVVFFAAGTAVLADPAGALDLVSGGRLGAPAYAAFAYDDDFLRLRGPVVLAVMIAGIALLTAVLIRGRWEPATRRAQLVLNVVTCAVLLWILFGGAVFRQAATDQTVKGTIGLIVLIVLADLVRRVRRQRRRVAMRAVPKIS
ncbi:PadR family transcriptional regulator [Streptosporangiaceae bacterium NEAU-GS5]|nr:PadR family transcriptional regulator [Streptosporangiaceae bacterium NEAU-GS5]